MRLHLPPEESGSTRRTKARGFALDRRKVLLYKSPYDFERVVEGLREAALPEP